MIGKIRRWFKQFNRLWTSDCIIWFKNINFKKLLKLLFFAHALDHSFNSKVWELVLCYTMPITWWDHENKLYEYKKWLKIET